MKNLENHIVLKGFIAFLVVISTTAWASSFEDFFSAVKRDDVSAVRQLAQRGFDLNTRNEAGEHALFLALRDDAPAVSSFLIGQDKVQVEARTGQDESPLMMAALKGRLEVARRLIERKAEVNKPGWAPLHYAATNADAEALPMVRLLLEEGADPLLKNQQGLSAIDFANRAQRAESAEIIAAFVRARQPKGRW